MAIHNATCVHPCVSQVPVDLLAQLLEKIREELPNLDVGDETEQIEKHFNNTLEHIRNQREANPTAYEGLSL